MLKRRINQLFAHISRIISHYLPLLIFFKIFFSKFQLVFSPVFRQQIYFVLQKLQLLLQTIFECLQLFFLLCPNLL